MYWGVQPERLPWGREQFTLLLWWLRPPREENPAYLSIIDTIAFYPPYDNLSLAPIFTVVPIYVRRFSSYFMHF